MKPAIETIAIIGAGALGGAYASLLCGANGVSVSFVASGDRMERLRREGLIINGRPYRIPVISAENLSAPSDLVIFSVKNHQLEEAIRETRNRVGEETTIISILNGIESEERIGAVYGMNRVLYAISVGINSLRNGNRLSFNMPGKLFFGEARNEILSDRVKRLQNLFDQTGIVYEIPPDMIRTLWWKFMINVGMNQVSAVFRAPFGIFQTPSEANSLMRSAMREVIMLARKKNVQLYEEDIERWEKVLSGLDPEGMTSMLQDVDAGRKTEVDVFAGKVIELGKCYSVPTPVNLKLFQAIKEIERQRSHGDPALG